MRCHSAAPEEARLSSLLPKLLVVLQEKPDHETGTDPQGTRLIFVQKLMGIHPYSHVGSIVKNMFVLFVV